MPEYGNKYSFGIAYAKLAKDKENRAPAKCI